VGHDHCRGIEDSWLLTACEQCIVKVVRSGDGADELGNKME
jgi:hypothetical protein